VPNWSFCTGWSSTATPFTTWAGAVGEALLGSRATLPGDEVLLSP
jgi:hypothetical protein